VSAVVTAILSLPLADVEAPATTFQLPSALEITAVTAGALSGSLHATRRGMDLLGVLVVAICTGIGGGAIRDIILNNGLPVFLVSPTLLANAVLAGAVATLFARPLRRITPAMEIVDILVIGAWVVIGLQKALLLNLDWLSAVFIGVVAAVGGSVLRDVLCSQRPEVLDPGTFFAAAALGGALAYVGLAALGAPTWTSVAATIVVASALRVASRWWGWKTTPATELSLVPPPATSP